MFYVVAVNDRTVTARSSAALYRYLKSLTMSVDLATTITEWANKADIGDTYDGNTFTVTAIAAT